MISVLRSRQSLSRSSNINNVPRYQYRELFSQTKSSRLNSINNSFKFLETNFTSFLNRKSNTKLIHTSSHLNNQIKIVNKYKNMNGQLKFFNQLQRRNFEYKNYKNNNSRQERWEYKKNSSEHKLKRRLFLLTPLFILLNAFIAFILFLLFDSQKPSNQQNDEEEGSLPPLEQPDITQRVYFDIAVGGDPIGRVEIGLFGDDVPKTVENFTQLVQHEKGFGYQNCMFHRIIKGFIIQGGDFERGDGTGGKSIYGKNFDDENTNIPHFPFCLSMANKGPNTNSSQFFITTGSATHLNGRHVVFGKILSGFDVIQGMERVATDKYDRPLQSVRIRSCGLLEDN
eukprot:gb/GECH01012909.1/.p1 GENE.gb/GECH01012909.1/~~gb/GECH01012909.1/.p1  ORF type:complete len:341 (+),score=69.05 gb/GECH01012909.1/:1-1023(+)